MPPTIITVRDQLLGSVHNFLDAGGSRWVELAKILTGLAVALPGYREEEVPLYPVVFLCDNLNSMIGSDQRVLIGEGPVTVETATMALGKCAPLAQGGWSIFIEHQTNTIRYGLFRPSTLSFSVSPEDVLAIADLEATHVVIARSLSASCVEIMRDFGESLQLHLSAGEPETVTVPSAIQDLALSAVRDAPSEWQEKTCKFLIRSLTRAIQQAHGTLIAVQESTLKSKEYNGIWLEEPIDLVKEVTEVEQALDRLGISRLQGTDYLIQGMIRSDGITLFSSDGKILGYNLFVQLQEKDQTSRGGARSRAFQALAAKVGKSLRIAVKISQDGKTERKGK